MTPDMTGAGQILGLATLGFFLLGPGLRAASGSDQEDPDVELNTVQILTRHGYPAEAHTIQTDDGYLLTLHRIPSARNRTAVFLQHGLLGSSADWLFAGPGEALAYLLADDGYDVWLGNARGNTYSRGHVNMTTSDSKYWDFSFHEMGYYDLPAAFDHVLKVTGKGKLFYIGHSMGTTMFYALMASRPLYNSKVHAMFAMAPVAFMSRVKSPIRILAPIANDIEFIAHFLGADEFLPQNKIIQLFAKYGCELYATERNICLNFIFLLTGFDADQFNMSILPVVLSHTPAGTSTKTLVHFAQEIKSGKFRQYDRGLKGNMEKYNSTEPPAYNLTAISTPVVFHYAKNDWLASTTDVEILFSKLQNRLGRFLVPLPKFNHLDFLWGRDAKPLVYSKIRSQMKKIAPPEAGIENSVDLEN